jgi:hypothetical protein
VVATALAACGPGLSPIVGDGGASSSGATTHATTEGGERGYEELWRLPLDRSIRTQPPVGDESGNVYVIAARDPPDPGVELISLIKVSEEGELAWELDFGSDPGFSGLAVGPDGDVWVCILGAVSRVSANGSLLWTEDDACWGEHSIAVGNGVSVMVDLREDEDEIGNTIYIPRVIALAGDGSRLWSRDVGVSTPSGPDGFERLGTSLVGAALLGTSVYVGCDTCSALPALVELDLEYGSIRGVGELQGVDWTEPRKTIFERPRVTADGVWVEAYEFPQGRRAWRWSAGSAAVPTEVSLPIEAEAGLTQRDYGAEDVRLIVDGEARVIDFASIAAEERASSSAVG